MHDTTHYRRSEFSQISGYGLQAFMWTRLSCSGGTFSDQDCQGQSLSGQPVDQEPYSSWLHVDTLVVEWRMPQLLGPATIA